MTHWPTSLRDVAYRLVLLRRLILTSTGLICAGLIGGSLLHQTGTLWDALNGALPVIALCLLTSASLAVLFPGAWIDHMSMASATAIGLLFWPGIEAVLMQSGGIAGILLLGPLVFILSTCVFMWLISVAHGRISMGQQRLSSETILPAPAATVMAWEFPQPNQQSGRRKTGPADGNGVFPMTFGFVFPEQKGSTIPQAGADQAFEPDCYLRIIERGKFHQITQYMMRECHGTQLTGASLVEYLEVEPLSAQACHYRSEEVHDTWDLVTWIAAWLNDQNRDYLRDMKDGILGIPTCAVRGLPQVTPMSLLAAAMTRYGLAPPPDPDARL